MFVDYSSLSGYSDINSKFAEKYTDLIFFEELSSTDVKLDYLKSRTLRFKWVQNLRLVKSRFFTEWIEYIFCLCVSLEQIRQIKGIMFLCPTLYLLEFETPSCSAKRAALLEDEEPLKRAFNEVYAEFVVARKEITDFLRKFTISGRPKPDEPYESWAPITKIMFGEFVKGHLNSVKARTDVIIIPEQFPPDFRYVITPEGYVKTKFKISFYKCIFSDRSVHPSQITADGLEFAVVKRKFTTIWQNQHPEKTFDLYVKKLEELSCSQAVHDVSTDDLTSLLNDIYSKSVTNQANFEKTLKQRDSQIIHHAPGHSVVRIFEDIDDCIKYFSSEKIERPSTYDQIMEEINNFEYEILKKDGNRKHKKKKTTKHGKSSSSKLKAFHTPKQEDVVVPVHLPNQEDLIVPIYNNSDYLGSKLELEPSIVHTPFATDEKPQNKRKASTDDICERSWVSSLNLSCEKPVSDSRTVVHSSHYTLEAKSLMSQQGVTSLVPASASNPFDVGFDTWSLIPCQSISENVSHTVSTGMLLNCETFFKQDPQDEDPREVSGKVDPIFMSKIRENTGSKTVRIQTPLQSRDGLTKRSKSHQFTGTTLVPKSGNLNKRRSRDIKPSRKHKNVVHATTLGKGRETLYQLPSNQFNAASDLPGQQHSNAPHVLPRIRPSVNMKENRQYGKTRRVSIVETSNSEFSSVRDKLSSNISSVVEDIPLRSILPPPIRDDFGTHGKDTARYTFLPSVDNNHEPEMVLMFPRHSKREPTFSERMRSLMSTSNIKAAREERKLRSDYEYDLMYPTLNEVSFRKFMKFKMKRLKENVKYYQSIAKRCVEDFKGQTEPDTLTNDVCGVY
ncbi:LAMI_0H10242g1_1 [Lachancea mirantina]|uniref:LAMI_0H10242g1_1 n=1 Tax=Lachancea mirantina TaxID=1230905 RepID=A0A1G4KGX4_9SACH|nr:LAMI_0H10242g1_1 [Lachancea mirantina]